jgi:hypothetical protein
LHHHLIYSGGVHVLLPPSLFLVFDYATI